LLSWPRRRLLGFRQELRAPTLLTCQMFVVSRPLPMDRDTAWFSCCIKHSLNEVLPYFRSLIARSTSLPASRALIDSRRSCCFFPLANPSSTLAWPRSEKYIRSGISVSPFCWVLPRSLLISFR